jgi:hypothetical protein
MGVCKFDFKSLISSRDSSLEEPHHTSYVGNDCRKLKIQPATVSVPCTLKPVNEHRGRRRENLGRTRSRRWDASVSNMDLSNVNYPGY